MQNYLTDDVFQVTQLKQFIYHLVRVGRSQCFVVEVCWGLLVLG